MITRRLELLIAANPDWETDFSKLETASSLVAVVWVAWRVGLEFARRLVEMELSRRAKLPTQWPSCPHCGTRLNSKGFQSRSMLTLVGRVKWSRRVGRCPKKCQGSQRVPLDESLSIQSEQKTSDEVIKLGCLLSIFVPFDIAIQLLEQLTSIKVCSQTIANWVTKKGRLATEKVSREITDFSQGKNPVSESLSSQLQSMTLAIAADGVMVPFRPQENSP